MLIGVSGEKLGLLSVNDALAKAQQDNIDLVQVSTGGTQPVVCKLMDYGKYVFAKNINLLLKQKLKEHQRNKVQTLYRYW